MISEEFGGRVGGTDGCAGESEGNDRMSVCNFAPEIVHTEEYLTNILLCFRYCCSPKNCIKLLAFPKVCGMFIVLFKVLRLKSCRRSVYN